MKRICVLMSTILFCLALCAQETFFGTVEFDRTVHDFGDVLTDDGALSCSFTVRNKGSHDFIIRSVVSSCGCTNVRWTTSTIAPGKSGAITAEYSNDEGPYPFDKTLTVYIADYKPVILHIRGIVHEHARPLSETYPVHFGSLGLRSAEIKAGNMSQGGSVSGEFTAANTGSRSIKLSFKDIDPDLTLKPSSVVIKAGSTAAISYSIRSNRSRWGKNWYYVCPLVDGIQTVSKGRAELPPKANGAEALRSDPNPDLAEGSSVIGFWAITKENFDGMSNEDKKKGPLIQFTESSFDFGHVRRGKVIKASFGFTNNSPKELLIYKIDSESRAVTVPKINDAFSPGSKSSMEFTVDTGSVPKGEQLFLLTLYTNSPQRPMVNLFITGFVQ